MHNLLKFLSTIIILHFSSALMAAHSSANSSSVPPADYHCANNTQISISQCQALVDFYYSTGGPNWLNRDTHTWLSNTTPCSWEGVVCWGNKVVRLEVPSNGLQGKLPDLRELVHLMQLGLFGNPELTGPLPELTQLPNLSKIIIFNTAINGFLPDIANLPQLTDLVIFNSNFTGPIPDISHLTQFVGHGNALCLSPRVDYSTVQESVSSYTLCQPMLTDLLHGVLDVTDFGVIPDDNKNDHQTINHALNMLKMTLPEQAPLTHLTLHFPPGTYNIEKSIKLSSFSQLTIQGEKGESLSSILLKGEQFGNNTNGLITESQQGAIFDLRYGDGLTLKYLKLEGQLKSTSVPFLWWDIGIHVGSSHHTIISNNEFHNFGDSAIAIVTDNEDTSGSINSIYNLVHRNYFYNITQTSTTSNGGGSMEYNFVGNTAEHVKGSIKFATRKEGAAFLNIMDNNVVSAGVGSGISTNNGFEIEGYKNINISDNTLSNGDGVGIVIRSAQSATTPSAYDWGDVSVVGNHISGYRQGIYISNLPHNGDGSLATAKHITVSDNLVENMWNGQYQAAIHFVGSQFEQCRVSNNTVVGGLYDVWPYKGEMQGLHIEGNTLN